MFGRYDEQPPYVQQYVALHKATHDGDEDRIDAIRQWLIVSLLIADLQEDRPMYMLAHLLTHSIVCNEVPGVVEDMPLDPQWIETTDLAMADMQPKQYLPDYVEATCAGILKGGGSKFDKIGGADAADRPDAIVRYAAFTDVLLRNMVTAQRDEASTQDAEQMYWKKFHMHLHDAFLYLCECAGKKDLEDTWGLPILQPET